MGFNMKPVDIARSFKRKVGQEVSLEAEGLDRFVVYTPFQFEDGDHYVVVLKRMGENWVLSDEGHTFMHLSYSEVDLSTGTRAELISRTLLNHQVENDDGELRLVIPGRAFGDALFSFVQALGQVANTALWTREVVRSTFAEDFAAIIESTIPFGKAKPNYSDPTFDPNGDYVADYKIDAPDKPYLVFGITSVAKCKDATITCYEYEKKKGDFGSIAIYENQEAINAKSVAQLTNVVGKQFPNLGDKDRIRSYLQREVMKRSA